MTKKRFVTGGYKIYDTYKEDEYLVNNVDAQRIVDTMNNLDTKARERSKALSKLEKENEQLKKELEKISLVNELLSMDLKESEHELWKENEQLKTELDKYNEMRIDFDNIKETVTDSLGRIVGIYYEE